MNRNTCQVKQEINSFKRLRLLTLFSYEWFFSLSSFSPVLSLSSLLYEIAAVSKSQVSATRSDDYSSKRHWLPVFLRDWCKLLLSLSLSLYLCSLHTSLFSRLFKGLWFSLFALCTRCCSLCFVFKLFVGQDSLLGAVVCIKSIRYVQVIYISTFFLWLLFNSYANRDKSSLFVSDVKMCSSKISPQALLSASLLYFTTQQHSRSSSALSCHSTSLSWRHSLSMVALRCKPN